MPFYADTQKTKPVHQSFGLAGYLYPQQDHQKKLNRLFAHEQQKDQVKQANVQLLNEALITDTQQTIQNLKEALENQEQEVPENIRQAEHLINMARSAAGTDRGNKVAMHYMEQAQRLGVFDEELHLNPEFFDVPGLSAQPQAGGQGQVPGFTETGEINPDSPQAFELMQAEVAISDFQRLGGQLQQVESQITAEREKEVPDAQTLERLEERQSNLQAQIDSLRENEYVQRWDTQNRYQQLQQHRQGEHREQQFNFMHGQRGQIDHDRLLDMSYEQAMRSFEGDSPDMERAQDYIGSVRRGKFQQGGLSFEQAGPHLERIDNLLEGAGYDQQQRRGALNRIIKEDFGVDMDGGDPDSEQGEQMKAQEASIVTLPGSGEAGGRGSSTRHL